MQALYNICYLSVQYIPDHAPSLKHILEFLHIHLCCIHFQIANEMYILSNIERILQCDDCFTWDTKSLKP